MAWMKRTALGLVAVALLAGAGAAVYVQRSFAQLDGSLAVAGLSEAVQVRRDGADVTHIQAQTPQDAWFAMGYVHAQERTWQLEFNRRVMHGQLSEVFGPATVETDKLMRSLDIMGVARRQYAGLPLYAQEALQAYSKGIHAFHQKRPQALPPEFLVLGVQPGGAAGAVWEPEDSVGWALMMALDLGGNWGTEFARLSVARTLDTDRLWQLMPPYPGEPPAASADLAALYRQLGVYRAPAAGAAAAAVAPANREGPLSRQISAGMLAWADELTRNAGTNEGKGSNNWVIAGTRTVSGKPLLANDPHLGLSAPAIWYFAGLQALFTAFFASIPNDWYRSNRIANYEGYYASVFYSHFAALGLEFIAIDRRCRQCRFDLDFIGTERMHINIAGRVVAAFKLGFEQGVMGHVSVRDPEHADQLWMNPFAVSFDRIRVSDLLRIRFDGTLLEGDGLIHPGGINTHIAILSTRPELNAVAHVHSTYGTAWSALNRLLPPVSAEAAVLYERHAVYDTYRDGEREK